MKKTGGNSYNRIIPVRNLCGLEVLPAEVTDEFTVRLTSSIRSAVVSILINSNYHAKYTFSKVPVGEHAFVIAYK
ncbi:hypothetical protein N8089_00270 [Flavobacteriales bacterium]|nr:hypothetical protein [Flavobacteriales bacterium]